MSANSTQSNDASEGERSDSVLVAFGLMLDEIDRKTEEVNAEGETAFRNADYVSVKEKVSQGELLKSFKEKVEILRDEWVQKFSDIAPLMDQSHVENLVRTINSASKGPRTRLVVKFDDNTTIYESTAAETYAKALQKIGFSRIEKLGLTMSRYPIVSRQQPTYSYITLGSYYVVTHSSTAQKQSILEKISRSLDLNLIINIVQ